MAAERTTTTRRRVGTTLRLNPLFLLVLVLCVYYVAVSMDATRDLLKTALAASASSFTDTTTAPPPPSTTTTAATTATATTITIETDTTTLLQRNNDTIGIINNNNMTMDQNIAYNERITIDSNASSSNNNNVGGVLVEQASMNDTNTQTTTTAAATNEPEPFFSACLLVMDDNFRLREWLAYQYHVLPLRHLVVAVDPRSRTSPTPILDMARQELGMTITEWTDADFDYHIPNRNPNSTSSHKTREEYLIRQRRFIGKCVEHFYQLGHKWTASYDTDEYPTIDPHTETVPFAKVTGLDDLHQPGSILRYILEGQKQGVFTEDCIVLPRVLFGAVHNETDTDPSVLPRGLNLDDPARLDTLRFRRHGFFMDKDNGLGKPIIDASRIGPLIPLRIRNPHRIVFQICGSPYPGDTVKKSPFRVNHYLGSWEQYSFRDDSRKGADRSREAWEFRAHKAAERDHVTHTWLEGFVQSVGPEKATRVLQGTGLPRNYTNQHNHSDWSVDLTQGAFRRKDTHHTQFINYVKNRKEQGNNVSVVVGVAPNGTLPV